MPFESGKLRQKSWGCGMCILIVDQIKAFVLKLETHLIFLSNCLFAISIFKAVMAASSPLLP